MVKGARFTRGEFARLFLGSRRHRAREILWATYERDGTPTYFVIDDGAFAPPAGDLIGIPYVTELSAIAREAARGLLRTPFIEQLDRPRLLPRHPTGTVKDLDDLGDASLWTASAPAKLRAAGFRDAGDNLERRYRHGEHALSVTLVAQPGTPVMRVVTSSDRDTYVPLAILNEVLLDIARALVPAQSTSYPMLTRVHAGTLCTLCGDAIEDGVDATVFQRDDSDRPLAALHPSCRPFSLAARLFAG